MSNLRERDSKNDNDYVTCYHRRIYLDIYRSLKSIYRPSITYTIKIYIKIDHK